MDLMQAVLISIGDELTLGQTIDTNSAWVAQRLSRLGIPCLMHMTVADEFNAVVECFKDAAELGQLIIASGGLGPTPDDLTREALAEAMGVELELHEPSLEVLKGFFEKRGKVMPERNLVQAMRPAGSRTVPNANGTAPGLAVEFNGARVYLTPGVPREMKAMLTDSIEPELKELAEENGTSRVILTETIRTFGAGESDVSERLGDLMARDRDPTVGTTVAEGMCSVRVRSEGSDADAAAEALQDTIVQVESILSPIAFGRGDEKLAAATLHALQKANLTVATAESCTGGMVGSLITEIPGSSTTYRGGWVVYANEMKIRQLGVAAETIEAHGAVSPQTAAEMALQALKLANADLAISITGIAGPGGGSDERPAGLVYTGLAKADGTVEVRRALLPGERNSVRQRSAMCALQWLRLTAIGESADHIQWLQPVQQTEVVKA